jgi:radical SAM protein with 4Fe4S-binding SPASM domain
MTHKSMGLAKTTNLILAGYSFLKSNITRRASVYSMPPAIGVELTNHCNLQCPECSSGSGQMKRGRGFMDLQLFEKAMSELAPYLFYINLYFQGEPMLHPQFFSFLATHKGAFSVVSTNGHFLSIENAEKLVQSGLNKLIVSLDGMTQESYSAYRKGGSIDKVIEGIRNISEAKGKFRSSLKLEIQFLINRINENQVPIVRQFAESMKASLSLKSMQVINRNNFEKWLPEKESYSRYTTLNGEYQIKNLFPDRCARLWFNPVITWDGKVIPCCFDKDAEHILGDLDQDTLRDIWNGPKYRSFRKSILSGRHMTEICRNCTSGLRGVAY